MRSGPSADRDSRDAERFSASPGDRFFTVLDCTCIVNLELAGRRAAKSMQQPLYMRIQDELRGKIAAGELVPGDRVPSENTLAHRFHTTRATVRQALAQLAFEGVIHRQAGLGTFVASPPVEAKLDTRLRQSFEEQIEAAGLHVAFELLAFDEGKAPAPVRETMGLRDDSPVCRLRRLRLVNGNLIGLEDRYMLAEAGAEIAPASLSRLSAIALMDATSAGPVDSIVVSVSAAAAAGEIAARLKVSAGSPVLVRDHRFHDAAGRVILCGSAVYRGDAYRFSYTLRHDGVTPSNSPIP